MKKHLGCATALLALCASAPVLAGTQVGVSVSVNQPGLYGRIDIGAPAQPPALVFPQPMLVAPVAGRPRPAPVYMHVPPGHAKNWRKHCHRYDACSQPVYFVQEDWYQRHHGQAPQGPGPGPGYGPGPGHEGKERGRGHGNGRGHGRGRGDD